LTERAAAHRELALMPVRALWTLPLNNDLSAPPAFDDSHGFFPIDGDRIVAYMLTTGTQKWIVEGKPLFEPVAGHQLLFVVEAGTLTARRTPDGSIAWRLPLSDELATAPAWTNGWIVLATKNREVVALRDTDGHLAWRETIGSDAHARPTLTGDRVYIPTADGRIVALRQDTGERIWERTLGAAANEVLALNERVYVGSNDNNLYCLMTRDGIIDWKWPTGGDVIGLPAHDDHNVYFVSLDNVLRALDLRTGGQKWKIGLPFRPLQGPVRAGDAVIVSGRVPPVRAYAVADGKAAGDFGAGSELAAAPRLFIEDVTHLPSVIVVTRDIAKGAIVTTFTRSIEPALTPVGPLPNVVTIAAPKPGT